MASRAERSPWTIFEETQPIRLYAKNQTVYSQEETAVQFYYLRRGSVKIYLSSPDGAEHTLRLVQPGELFGEASFFDGAPRVSSARTLEKSEIVSVNRPALLRCIVFEWDGALRHLHSFPSRRSPDSAQVDAMAFLRGEERVWRLLRRLAGEDGEVSLTHEEIASLTGLTRVSASRILKKLADEGKLRREYGRVVLSGGQVHPAAEGAPRTGGRGGTAIR